MRCTVVVLGFVGCSSSKPATQEPLPQSPAITAIDAGTDSTSVAAEGPPTGPNARCLRERWMRAGKPDGLAFSPDDRFVALANESTVTLLDAATGRVVRETRLDVRDSISWQSMIWRGERLLLLDDYDYVLLRTTDLSPVCNEQIYDHSLHRGEAFSRATFDLVRDEHSYVTMDASCAIRGRTASPAERILATGYTDTVWDAALTSDRRYLFVMPTSPGELEVWDVGTGRKVHRPAHVNFAPETYFHDVADDSTHSGRAQWVLDPASGQAAIREAVDLSASISSRGTYVAQTRCNDGGACTFRVDAIVACPSR